jgi:hypothetical protein
MYVTGVFSVGIRLIQTVREIVQLVQKLNGVTHTHMMVV